jgi:hypothetical protein
MEVGGLYRSVALRLDVGREFHSHMGNHFPLGQYQNDGETRKERGVSYSAVSAYFTKYTNNTVVPFSKHVRKIQNILL